MIAVPDLFGPAALAADRPSATSPAVIRAAVERERRALARLGRPRNFLGLHAGACHDVHRARRAVRIGAFMSAAGFPDVAAEPAPAHPRQEGAQP